MTQRRDFKALVRARMAHTGESYAAARAVVERTKKGGDVPPPPTIPGWSVAGDCPWAYRFAIEPRDEGGRCASITYAEPNTGFATLVQTLDSAEWVGRRVRWSALVQCDAVEGYAALWMRVDGRAREMLAFDNMFDRRIVGTRPWRRYDVVLDVSDSAVAVAFGALLSGVGLLRIAECSFECVSLDVAVTAREQGTRPRQPRNLWFDE
jgi:hypothetical protein